MLRAPDDRSRKLILAHPEKDLAELHRLAIFGHHFGDDAAGFRFDFVHHFHRLDNANHRVFGNVLPTSTNGAPSGEPAR